MAVNSLQKQREGATGRPFPKGQSGNPAGRPPGARNHATLAAEVLLEGEAEALTRRAIECALEGDVTALRLCLERVLPRRKSRALTFELPPLDRVENLSGAIELGPAGGRPWPAPAGRRGGTGRHDGIPAQGHGNDRPG